MLNNSFNITLPVTDPVLIFALVMFIILVAPLAFRKLRIPPIVGLILAGAVVGPSVLGLLERDDTFILLGTVGLLYLMFMAGLSIDLNKFEKLRSRSLIFGLLSFFIPQMAGIFTGLYILNYNLPTSLLLGSIVGSHTLLAYPIANRLGITGNSSVTMAMGGTIVTDALSLTVLAFVVASAHGQVDLQFWLTFIGFVAVYLFFVLAGLPRLGQWFFRNVRDQTTTEYVFLIAILFITAYLAQAAGLAAIIGAFLAGITMNRMVPESSTLMNRVQFVGNALFIPFFLISVGMLVNIQAISSPEVLLPAVAFILLVVLGKLFAAKLTQYIYKSTAEEGWTVAGLTIPQAAATLAVTLVGFNLGFFSSADVNAVVILILITSLIGPWLVENYGRKVAMLDEKKPYKPSDAPQRILVPLANPVTAEALMDLGIIIRRSDTDEPLFPLTVARDSDDVEARVAESEKILGHAVVHAAAANVPVIPVTRVDINIASGMVRAIKELRISHVIIGWSGQTSAHNRIFGSVLDQLLDQTDEMIMVCKLVQPLNTTKRVILVVPPLSEHEPGFNTSLEMAQKLVSQLGAELAVTATEQNIDTLEEYISGKTPELKADYHTMRYWSDIHVYNEIPGIEKLTSDDLIILFSAREGTVSWQPNLKRLPRQFANEFPMCNLIIVYPSEKLKEEISTLQINFGRTSRLPNITTRNITPKIDHTDYESALKKIMQAHFHNKESVLDITVKKLLRVDPDNMPGELPGVLLTHTSSLHVTEPTIFLGLSPQGVYHEKMNEPVKVIFVLLSPRGFPVQRNLDYLGRVARLLRSPEIVDRLSQSTSVQQIRDILSAKLVFTEPSKDDV